MSTSSMVMFQMLRWQFHYRSSRLLTLAIAVGVVVRCVWSIYDAYYLCLWYIILVSPSIKETRCKLVTELCAKFECTSQHLCYERAYIRQFCGAELTITYRLLYGLPSISHSPASCWPILSDGGNCSKSGGTACTGLIIGCVYGGLYFL